VCLKFFCFVFQISYHIVDAALRQWKDSGVFTQVVHGNSGHTLRNKPEEDIALVKDHIGSFPVAFSLLSKKK